jgi:hypothetical protein
MPKFKVYAYHIDRAAVVEVEAGTERAAWEEAVAQALDDTDFLKPIEDDPDGLYIAMGKSIYDIL